MNKAVWLGIMSEGHYDDRNEAQTVETTLGLLNAIDSGASHTQRGLSQKLGIALGLTNALVKRCVKKGLVKVMEAPTRRFAYYLTPKGFKEKSHLTAQYLSISLDFYRRARAEYEEAIAYCEARGWKRVALYGASELVEIAGMATHSGGVRLVGVVDEQRNLEEIGGVKVYNGFVPMGPIDAVIITDAKNPQTAFDSVIKGRPKNTVLTPAMLHVSRGESAQEVEE